MKYVLIVLDRATDEVTPPAGGGIQSSYSTREEAVEAGRECLADADEEELIDLVVSVVDLETMETDVLHDSWD